MHPGGFAVGTVHSDRPVFHESGFFEQKIDEVRGSDERGHGSGRDAGRIGHVAADHVGRHQQHAAGKDGDRQRQLVARPDKRLGDMRRHQPDEGNAAGDSDRGGRQGDGGDEQLDPLPVHGQADADGYRLAQLQQIELVGLVESERNQDDEPRQESPDEDPVGSPDAAREPFGDEVHLLARGRRDDDDHDAGEGQGKSDPDQHEPDRLEAFSSSVGEQVDEQSRGHRAGEGDERDQVHERAGLDGGEQEEERDAEAGAGIDADNAGIRQIVAGHPLQDGAGEGEAHAGQERNEDSREPDREDQIFLDGSVAEQHREQALVAEAGVAPSGADEHDGCGERDQDSDDDALPANNRRGDHWNARPPFFTIQRKNGRPIMATMAVIDVSYGALIVRPSVSATSMSAPPPAADIGMTNR
ncbi:hypothetical protein BN871_EY_00210 [Paenibacillus sp. P22]|nr:hypothetical protein BN871_EY_00210 [Paenibacillus sp. P22]